MRFTWKRILTGSANLADDAHGGLLGILAQGVVLQDTGELLLVDGLGGGAQNLDIQVIGIYDTHIVANALLDLAWRTRSFL